MQLVRMKLSRRQLKKSRMNFHARTVLQVPLQILIRKLLQTQGNLLYRIHMGRTPKKRRI